MSRATSSKSNKLKKDGSKKSTASIGGDTQSGIGGEEVKKLQEELAKERQERNFFQLERVL
jgi:hypothetical protein